MYLMAIISVFGVPAYSLAKSKGRSGRGYAILTVLLGLPTIPFGVHMILLPTAMLGVLYFLPARPGAPGKAYLKIVFPCPECGKTVSFPRHREGVAVLCPECDEIIRVPEDEYSPTSQSRNLTTPEVTQGEVCFETFGRPEPAHLLASQLCDNGINVRVQSDGGGVLPQIGNSQGHRVMIDAAQWDEAVEFQRSSHEINDL